MIKPLFVFLLVVVGLLASKGNRPVSTVVTGLWNINRGELKGQFQRSFEYYLDHFKVLLQTEANLIIFGTKELKLFVEQHRKRPNYVFIVKELEWFEGMWHNPLIERVRKHYKKTLVDWPNMQQLPEYGLYLYNAVVMTKLFLMRQALDYDLWNSDFFLWQDGGINHSYFDQISKQSVVSPANILQQMAYMLPWPLNFHFDINNFYMEGFARKAHANFFNVYIEMVQDFAAAYQNHLRVDLEQYDMTTDEGIFTKMHTAMPYLMPMVNRLPENSISHHFQVNNYFQQRTRAVRHFSFGRDFEQVIEEMQQQHELSSMQDKPEYRSTLAQERALCGRAFLNWMVQRNLAYSKVKVVKVFSLLCLLILLMLKTKIKTNQKQKQKSLG